MAFVLPAEPMRNGQARPLPSARRRGEKKKEEEEEEEEEEEDSEREKRKKKCFVSGEPCQVIYVFDRENVCPLARLYVAEIK